MCSVFALIRRVIYSDILNRNFEVNGDKYGQRRLEELERRKYKKGHKIIGEKMVTKRLFYLTGYTNFNSLALKGHKRPNMDTKGQKRFEELEVRKYKNDRENI